MAQTLKFKPIPKDRLFYDSYRYCISFYLAEVSALKILDHKHIDAILNRRRTWRDGARTRWASAHAIKGTLIPPIIMRKRWRDITDDIETDLHEVAHTLIKTSIDFKLTTSVDHGWVYTNNVRLINRLNALGTLKDIQFTEAVINRPKNTIILKEPKYTNRSYFKSAKLTAQQKLNLNNFLTNQKDYLRISPSLNDWLSSDYHRIQDYFFIDHTGDSWLLLLSLVHPGLIRKTLEILPA